MQRSLALVGLLLSVALVAAAAPAQASILTDVYFTCHDATSAPQCYDAYLAAYNACLSAFSSAVGPEVPSAAWSLLCFG